MVCARTGRGRSGRPARRRALPRWRASLTPQWPPPGATRHSRRRRGRGGQAKGKSDGRSQRAWPAWRAHGPRQAATAAARAGGASASTRGCAWTSLARAAGPLASRSWRSRPPLHQPSRLPRHKEFLFSTPCRRCRRRSRSSRRRLRSSRSSTARTRRSRRRSAAWSRRRRSRASCRGFPRTRGHSLRGRPRTTPCSPTGRGRRAWGAARPVRLAAPTRCLAALTRSSVAPSPTTTLVGEQSQQTSTVPSPTLGAPIPAPSGASSQTTLGAPSPTPSGGQTRSGATKCCQGAL
mmetsp:Transcript_5791/g.11238  ORF Transcript_5791/g.11238 Transcript_5791/m.11238 type:complete len:293 (+) Transcript_5791:286-1164(+)